MTNEFYDPPELLAPGVKARSADINQINQRIGTAFDKMPGELAMKGGLVNFGANTAAVNDAYAVTLSSKITAYVDGLEVKLRPLRDNTGACTINVNGLGNKAIKRTDGTNPQAGDIQTNATIYLSYSTALNAFVLPPVVNSQLTAATNAAISAADSANAAAAWATSLAVVGSGYYGARYYAQAASGSATLAQQWATNTASLVDGVSYGAKYYSQQASVSATSAKDWATKMTGAVSGGLYSAQYWADQAATYAAQTAAAQVQADWNEASSTSKAFILNKPSLASYAPKDAPAFTGTATFADTGMFYYNTDNQVHIRGSAIEIGRPGRAAPGSAYVDFHSATNSGDYDVRLIATGGDSANIGKGALNIIAQTLTWNGTALLTGSVYVNPTFTGDGSSTNVTAEHGTLESQFTAKSGAGYGRFFYRISDINAGVYVMDGSGNGSTRLRFIGPTGLVAIAESGTGNVIVGRGTDDGSGAKLQVAGAAKVNSLTVVGATTFTGDNTMSGTYPAFVFDETDQAGAVGKWRMAFNAGVWRFDMNTAAARDFSTLVTPLSISTTGVVSASTPATSNNGSQLATTAYVVNRIAQDAMAAGAKPATAVLADSANKVNGKAYTNGTDGWFRSQGNVGWFNEDWGVGIYADSAGVVKTYGSAQFTATQFNGSGAGLTGTGASFTAGSASNVGGYTANISALAGTCAVRDGNGDINQVCALTATVTTNRSDTGAWNGRSFTHYGMSIRDGYNLLSGYNGLALIVGGYEKLYCGTSEVYCSVPIRSAGDITAFSDERIKANWRPVTDDFVAKWAGVKYGVYDRTDIKATQAGLSAQSVQKILPEVVIEGEGERAPGILSLSYGPAAAIATVELAKLAVEQAKKIEDLTNLVNNLVEQIKGMQPQ